MKKLCTSLLLLISMASYGQQDSIIPFEKAYKRVYHVSKIPDADVTIDGRLDEEIWKTEEGWTEDFLQTLPRERVVPESKTRAKLFYDDKYIYVGFYCQELQPDKMNRFIGNRDDNGLGDLVSVAFDTYHDYRAASEFNLNLGGNKTDLIVTDQLDINMSWNAVWEGRTYINKADSFWTAEIRIPFSQLRYNYNSEDGIWGLHIRRTTRHNNELQKWSLIPRKNNGHVFSFGEMHGMTDVPKPRGIEILPYVMGKYKNEPKIPGSPYQKGSSWKGNAGLDAKFALSDFTLDVAINPDFGQVELDPSVMNLTAYETFYDEKRPFFLEGKHILDFNNSGDMMFYTRRIGASPSYHPQGIDNVNSFAGSAENVPIIGALKLTGTNKRGVTIGVVQSITARSSLKVTRDGSEHKEVVEPLTNYTVARVQKNWKGNSLLGGMVTSVNRALDEPHLENMLIRNAFTTGVDFTQYFANRLYYIDAKGMFSTLNGTKEAVTRLQQSPIHYYQRTSATNYLGVDPNRTSLSGTGGSVEVGRKGNSKWNFMEKYSWSSPGFDLNTIGYMREADFRENETEVSFRQTEQWKIFRSNTITLAQENVWNYGGQAVENNLSASWSTMFINRFEASLSGEYGWNYIDSRILRGGPDLRLDPYVSASAQFNTDKGKRLMFNVEYEADLSTNGFNKSHTITPSLTWRIGNRIYFSGQFNYNKNIDHLQYVTTIPSLPISSKPEYVMGKLDQQTYGLTLRLQMNVTPDISIQFYGSPYTSTGKYTQFKGAANTLSRTYEDRFNEYRPADIIYTNDTYTVNKDGESFKFENPDFSFNEFRSNLVARWEYRPGSTLYLVWEHTMSNRDRYVISGWGDNIDRMFGLPATNVLMVKLNYWFSL